MATSCHPLTTALASKHCFSTCQALVPHALSMHNMFSSSVQIKRNRRAELMQVYIHPTRHRFMLILPIPMADK